MRPLAPIAKHIGMTRQIYYPPEKTYGSSMYSELVGQSL